MIQNLKQYEITQKAANSFRWALKNLSSNDDENLHPLLIKVRRDAVKSQLDDLENQLKVYELENYI